MADDSETAASDEEEESGPIVELGEGPAVDGAPLARLSSRLHFGIERSEVVRRVGGTEVRTPDGPRTVESILDETDDTYFPTSEDFRGAVESVVGTGPVPTHEREDSEAAPSTDEAVDADENPDPDGEAAVSDEE